MHPDTVLNRSPYSLLTPLLMAVALVGLSFTQVKASIHLPDERLWDLEANPTEGMNSSSETARPVPADGRPPSDLRDCLTLAKYGTSTSGSSAPSTSSTHFGPPANVALTFAPLVPSDSLFGWLCSTARFAVPTPPYVELLRPPQIYISKAQSGLLNYCV